MHKLTSLLHKNSKQKDSHSAGPLQSNLTCCEQDLYRYRKQRGVNLGSWFVLESWISSSPFRFAKTPAQSDLDVARGSHAKEVLENHWDSWIVEEDWNWIRERGINTVRIPIGYYHLCKIDASVLHHTDFEGLHDIFEGAWNRITNAIAIAHRFGIGVLLDLHAAPGSQNADSHSGVSSHKAHFLKPANMEHTIHILRILLSSISSFPNVVGIELLNEPQPGDKGHNTLKTWYTNAIHELRSLDSGIPIYVSDSWQTDDYAGYISTLPQSQSITALDHHLYRCFTVSDTHTPISEHTYSLTDSNAATPQLFARVSSKLTSCSSAIVVGEWSGAVHPGSLHGLSSEGETNARKEYINAQLELYERCCAGWYFWTYKKEQSGDRGWSLKDAVGSSVFPQFVGMRVRTRCNGNEEDIKSRKNLVQKKALSDHSAYWSKYSGDFQHWRFAEGFCRGWDDAYMFFASTSGNEPSLSAHELGFIGAWTKRAVANHVNEKGESHAWEFEHGLSQGLYAARQDIEFIYC